MKRSATLLVSALLSIATAASAQWTSSRPDGHAPITVTLDHTHEAGEFMLSYRYMYMKMNGIRVGTDDADFADVVDPDAFGFTVTPTDMMMQMHMFGLMFAPSDRLTLVGMLPLKALEMDHLTAAFQEFTTESSGIGDVSLAGMWGLDPVGNQRVHIIFAASLPSGSIDERDQTSMSGDDEVQLPYPMQPVRGPSTSPPAQRTWGRPAIGPGGFRPCRRSGSATTTTGTGSAIVTSPRPGGLDGSATGSAARSDWTSKLGTRSRARTRP